MSPTRIWAVMRKEFLHVIRDRATLRIIIAMPLIMMFIFGYAVSTDIENVDTAVVIGDLSASARELVAKFEQSKLFRVRSYPGSPDQAESLLQKGLVKAALIIPADYSAKLARGQSAQIQLILDGSDPTISRTALSSAQMIAQALSAEVLAERLQRSGIRAAADPAVDLRPRVWYNPDMQSLRFNLPGLVGVIMQNLTVILTAAALVRERERGTIEQLIVTPVRPAELIIGKLAPYVVIAFIDVGIILTVSVFWFGLEIAGSLTLLLTSALIFVISSLGLGLLISTMAATQAQAWQMSQLILLPSILLSGYMFPRETMPQVLQLAGLGLPLTYYLQILRGIILKGSNFSDIAHHFALMGLYSAVILGLAVVRVRKRLD